jgi:hypothetical protein
MSMDANGTMVIMSHVLPWTGKQGKQFSCKILLSHCSKILDEIPCSAKKYETCIPEFLNIPNNKRFKRA